jgi:hypothetical protein
MKNSARRNMTAFTVFRANKNKKIRTKISTFGCAGKTGLTRKNNVKKARFFFH